MSTSFMSEHSAELTLVPDLIARLRPSYPTITPIYYWASREGGRMSSDSFLSKRIKVLAFYPRRPKVNQTGCGIINIKVNDLLLHRSEYLKAQGVATIAGVPLADKLEDVHFNTPCLWFEVTSVGMDEVFHVELATGLCSENSPRILGNKEIVEAINTHSKEMNWKDALRIIKGIGRSSENSYPFWNRMSGDLYKPIYFLIHL